MAPRMTFFVASVEGTSGNRTSSRTRPSSESAYFAPGNAGLREYAGVQRHESVLHAQRAGCVAA